MAPREPSWSSFLGPVRNRLVRSSGELRRTWKASKSSGSTRHCSYTRTVSSPSRSSARNSSTRWAGLVPESTCRSSEWTQVIPAAFRSAAPLRIMSRISWSLSGGMISM